MAFASKVSHKNTHVKAVVYRHDADPISFEKRVEDFESGQGSVVGLSMQKGLGAVGTFSLTMKVPRRFNLRKEIQSGDWIVWWWEVNGRAYHGSMGIVVKVGRGRTSVEGATAIEYPIVCADFTRVMERTVVWFDDFSDYETNAGGARIGSRMGFTPTGSPETVINAVIHAFLGQDDNGSAGLLGGSWLTPRGMAWIGEFFARGLFLLSTSTKYRNKTPTPADLIVGRPATLRGEVFGPEFSIFQPQPGTVLMQHIAALSNDLLNETFYDVLTEADGLDFADPKRPSPCVFVRERPFPNTLASGGLLSPWFSLPTVRINRNEGLIADNTETSDDERINLILLYGTGFGSSAYDQYALNPPAYHVEDIRRNGIRKFEKQTAFVGIGEASEDGTFWANELDIWHGLLADWYGLNHRWLSGSLSFACAVPDARVGRRIILDDSVEEEREQFYIEGVAAQWRYPKGATTQLTVTRGWKGPDQSLVDAVTERSNGFGRAPRGGNQGYVPIDDSLAGIRGQR